MFPSFYYLFLVPSCPDPPPTPNLGPCSIDPVPLIIIYNNIEVITYTYRALYQCFNLPLSQVPSYSEPTGSIDPVFDLVSTGDYLISSCFFVFHMWSYRSTGIDLVTF